MDRNQSPPPFPTNALFFYKDIAFPAEYYFSADVSLKMLLRVFLDYSVWKFCFRMCSCGVWMVLKSFWSQPAGTEA